MLSISSVVFVSGMCFIASLASPHFAIIPVLLAIVFPQDVMSASLIGMVSSLFMGFAVRFSGGSRR